MRQGRVYRPATLIPPGQITPHSVVVLTNNLILNRLQQSGGRNFVLTALIRSAGPSVRLVPLHSIPVTPTDLSWLKHDSIIETHQLFHVPLQELSGAGGNQQGDLPPHVLQQVLAGARALL